MRWLSNRWWISATLIVLLIPCIALTTHNTWAGEEAVVESDDRPTSYEGVIIKEVTIEGLRNLDEQLVRNQIRTTAGLPYRQDTIDQFDVPNLTRLNFFRNIQVVAESTSDGQVIVKFVLTEWTGITDVQVTGNRDVSDQEIQNAVRLRAGDPLDTFQITRAKEAIIALYKERGFYLAEVDVDGPIMTESHIVLFRVREGPRVRVKSIEFAGNNTYPAKQLRSQVKSKTWIFLLRTGELDEDAISADIAALIDYYINRGYLDIRVDRSIDISKDYKEAKITFVIDEGSLYTMRNVLIEGNSKISNEALQALLFIKPGDIYSNLLIRKSVKAVVDAHGMLGYVGTNVRTIQKRVGDANQIDLQLIISEKPLAYTGEIRVVGNELTKRKVIFREVPLKPDRPHNTLKLDRARQRLRATRLFDEINLITLDPETEGDLYRDLLVEVKEANTGKFGIGAAVSSDSGLLGQIEYEQRNFDLTDLPESFSELWSGRAFRGAGQTFNINLQPGDTTSLYSISLAEPYLFGTDYSGRGSLQYADREQESYDETRWGGNFRVAHRLGDRWVLSTTARWQSIDLHNIDIDAPTDVFAVEDENVISAIGFGLVRTTYDNRIRPSKGSRIELSFEQVGVLGGDFDFTKLEAKHAVYFTVDEDFLGRKSIVSLTTRAGYIFGDGSPTYERFYLGGRSLRGFDYRTVSPKGIQNNTGNLGTDPIGGDFMFAWGIEYEVPIYSRFISGVAFLDTGTVIDDIGFDDYRVAGGLGFRLMIPQLGQAPMAFDFAIPFIKGPGDQSQIFSFSIDVPL